MIADVLIVGAIDHVELWDPEVFAANLWGPNDLPLFDQVRGTLLVTVFAFIGVEGASAYSRHARRRSTRVCRGRRQSRHGGSTRWRAPRRFAGATRIHYGVRRAQRRVLVPSSARRQPLEGAGSRAR